ncbi:beta-galactosidase 13-like [Rhodamnia argentea]|uniref:Beta-galactosidase n=1 Tax=Rhodamnia argentea TaxID=178133 RepID=A0A8B8NQ09_9MYRT|nr:beta-galactosidase 13-like [Rhodamnia argentea]
MQEQTMSKLGRVFLAVLLASFTPVLLPAVADEARGVNYDGRSLIINGSRELLFSGSIHYPRSTPEMWGDILQKAKEGGLNVVQTYVFWNIHEPAQGQYNFNGNYDLVKFIKMIGELGMYATLRVGPFIEAEWNFGGFPYWLREVPNITFRTDNPPFKYHMKKFTKVVIKKMKDEKLFASQGGPIILSQIENEYNNIQLAYKTQGTRYIQWAGTMAVGLKTGVPWVMCMQKDAPDPMINTCNGRNCGDTFTGPNSPDKPTLWTENWTAQYRVFGDPPSQRSAEDLAYSVARFFSKNGTLANYYMYYGGTNFGRTASSFVTTRYYDEAPMDEYGLLREPKWGHLRDLHLALRLCKKALLWGTPSVQDLGEGLEARVYEKPGTSICAAFLCNNNTRLPRLTMFKGIKYYLPQRSISILADCKTVVYNTGMVVAQHSSRNYHQSETANKNLHWEMWRDNIPTTGDAPIKSKSPLELMSTTKDSTDYLWYATSIKFYRTDLPFRKDISPVLQVANLGHLMHAFVNGEYIGSGHGSNIEKSFVLQKAIELKPGLNNISLLGATVGFPDSGAYLEHRFAGVHAVTLKGLNTGTLDLSLNGWAHKVGLDGEKLRVYTQGGSHRVQWAKAKGLGQSLTWYKAYFDAPEGNDPVAMQLGTMSKGMAWVNGKSIGRYWSSYLSPLEKPSQDVYHVPRAFLEPTDNLLVLLEEIGGNPEGVQILTVNRDVVCSFISESNPATVKSWKRNGGLIQNIADDVKPRAHLQCAEDKKIVQVEFASYGNPFGSCGSYSLGNCSAAESQKVVEQRCLGRSKCSVTVEQKNFDKAGNLCPDVSKTLAIQVRCGDGKSSPGKAREGSDS